MNQKHSKILNQSDKRSDYSKKQTIALGEMGGNQLKTLNNTGSLSTYSLIKLKKKSNNNVFNGLSDKDKNMNMKSQVV